MIIIGTILVIIFIVMGAYSVRHYIFYWNRLFGNQKGSQQDLAGYFLPSVSIIVPMHNEENVAEVILERLAIMDYPKENGQYEVIAINDNSTDATADIIDKFALKYPFIKAVHRPQGGRGKGDALVAGTEMATNEIVLVFDADYQPSKACVKRLVAPFYDPEVGLVMGRVVPINTAASLMTRLLDLERSGGYQVDQQARYNLGLVPQYGGTVGGIRRKVLERIGGWNTMMLAEDTDITIRSYANGWKIGYVNIAECYEEAVENWQERRHQLFRWAVGHNQSFLAHTGSIVSNPILSPIQKVDGLLLLGVYLVPVLMFVGLFLSIIAYFFGSYWWWLLFSAMAFTISYNSVGNFAAFNEIGISAVLDKRGRVIWLLPWSLFNFFANIWLCTGAFLRSLVLHGQGVTAQAAGTKKSGVKWSKTVKKGDGNGNSDDSSRVKDEV